MRKLTLAFSSVVKLAIAILAIALLSACGTPYATVANRAGEPVMLLGYAPVAYFTKGEPWPTFDVGGMMTNLFTKPPGWRAGEGYSQPALGYPE